MIKDIMVHLDGSPEDEIRLEHGQALTSPGSAHLIGLFTNRLPELTVAMPMDGSAAAIQILTELQDQAMKDGDATAKRLMERLSTFRCRASCVDWTSRSAPCPHGWRSRPAAPISSSPRAPMMARRHPPGPTWSRRVLFGSGRAILLVPPGRHWQGPIRTVLVAWNGSRELARALRRRTRLHGTGNPNGCPGRGSAAGWDTLGPR